MTTEIQHRPMRMRRLIGWGVIGQVSYVVSQFIVLLALARFSDVETVGAFGLASAICFPIVLFFNLGLRINAATDVDSYFSFIDFVCLRIVTAIVAYAVVSTISVLALAGEARDILLIFGAAKAIELVSELCYGIFQKSDRMALVARSQAMRGFLSAAIFSLLLGLGASVANAFLGQLAIWSLVALLVDLRSARNISGTEGSERPASWRRVRELAVTSIPLGISGALSAIQGNVPRYAITTFLGFSALGQFTVVSYAMQAMATIFTAISQSIVARMSSYIKDGNRRAFFGVMQKFTIALIGFGCICAAASLFAGDFIIRYVFGPDYPDLGKLLALLVLAASFRSAMLVYISGLQAGRKFYQITFMRFSFVLVMAVACFISAAFGGLIGLGMAMCAVYLLQALTVIYLLKKLEFLPKG